MDASTIQQVGLTGAKPDVKTAFINTHHCISCTEAAINRALSRCGQQAHFIENSEYMQMGEFTIHIRDIPAGAHACAHTCDNAGKHFTTFYQLREADLGQGREAVSLWYWHSVKGGWVRSCLRETDLGVDSYHHNLKVPVRFYRLPKSC